MDFNFRQPPEPLGGFIMLPKDITAKLPRHLTKVYDLRERSDIKRIVIHTSNWETTPEVLAKYDVTSYYIIKGKKIYNHISKTGTPAITYHECIDLAGVLYGTLPWEEISWHVGAWNPGSLGICLLYLAQNKKKEDVYAPSDKMVQTLQTRCGDICLELGLTPNKVVGHRELKTTGWVLFKGSRRFRKTCPGMLLDLDLLRANISGYMQIKLRVKGLYDGKIDGDFGPVSRVALTAYKIGRDNVG